MAVVIKITIALLMLAMGLRITHSDVLLLWRRPKLLAECMVAAFVIVPLAAYAVFQILPLQFEARAGLWALAIAPGAPMIYTAASRRGVTLPELAASFQVNAALLVIVFAPLWLAIVSAVSGSDYRMPPRVILGQVATVQLIPIVVGIAIHESWPSFAERLGGVLSRIGMLGLLALVILILVVFGKKIVSDTDAWTVLAAAIMAAVAIASGHFLVGPDTMSRVTIANADAQRNFGLALAIVAWNLPERKAATVFVLVTYVLVAAVLSVVYNKLMGRRQAPS